MSGPDKEDDGAGEANGKMEGEVQGTMFLGRAYLKYGKVTNLAPI